MTDQTTECVGEPPEPASTRPADCCISGSGNDEERPTQMTDLHRLAGECSERILLYFDSYRIGSMAPIVCEIERALIAGGAREAREVERLHAFLAEKGLHSEYYHWVTEREHKERDHV